MEKVFSIVLFNKNDDSFYIGLNNKFKKLLKDKYFLEIKKNIDDLRKSNYNKTNISDDDYIIFLVLADNFDVENYDVNIKLLTKENLYVPYKLINHKIEQKNLVHFLTNDLLDTILKSYQDNEKDKIYDYVYALKENGISLFKL